MQYQQGALYNKQLANHLLTLCVEIAKEMQKLQEKIAKMVTSEGQDESEGRNDFKPVNDAILACFGYVEKFTKRGFLYHMLCVSGTWTF